MATRIEVWNDISEGFEFVEEKLVYVDAPLEGILKAKSGELFAFRCIPIIPNFLWHWVLLPVQSSDVTVAYVFSNARSAAPGQWVSIVEDRRADQPLVRGAWMVGGVHPIPENAFG